MFLFGFLLFFCTGFSAQTGESIYDVSCYNKYDKGVTYNGIVSTGFLHNKPKRCLNWKTINSPYTRYYQDHNYCRNPRPDAFNQPWCYTGFKWETGNCTTIPICDCRNSTFDLKYNGSIQTTRRGNTCRSWSTASYYTKETANYCRTPGTDTDNGGGPWCYVDVGWERCNIPVCGGSFCPDLSSVLTLDKKSKYQYGEIAIVAPCQQGYRPIEKTYLECNATGGWNDTVPTCKEITCPPFNLDNTVHASIQPNPNKYNVNTRVTLSCISGYNGLDIVTVCQANGQWSNQQTPRCTEITCPPFILDNNGHASIQPDRNKYVFNTKVTLSCILGYTGLDTSAVCLVNGHWSSKQLPRCTQITCQPFNLDNNGHASIQPDLNKYVFNTRVTLSCIPGYTGLDTDATCLFNGEWSSQQTPRCTPANCGNLTVGAYVKPSKQLHKFNDNVTLSCEEGYFGVSISIKCYADGSWPTDRPNCKPITCSMLTVNDRIMKSENISKFNDNVTLSCKQGYIRSSVILKCNAAGFWPSQRPNCTAATCQALRQVPHQKLEPVQIVYSYRDNVTFKCNDGYMLTTEYTRTTCQSDGTWNNKQPNCTGVPCPHLPYIHRALLPNQTKEYRYPEALTITCETGYVVERSDLLQCNSSGLWNSIPQCTCIENSQSYKDSMVNRSKCISYGSFGGILAAIVAISAGLQIATCFYYRKRVEKSAALYEDMQFNTVERQRSSKDETYSELT